MSELYSKEELSGLQSSIMTLYHAYIKEGYNSKDAHELASSDVAQKCGVDRDTLLTKMSQSRMSHHPREVSVIEELQAEPALTITGMMREFAKISDHIPGDEELSHFTKFSRDAIRRARSRLRTEEGFEFESDALGIGWNVTNRPVAQARMYTEAEVRAMMEDIIKKFS